MRATTLLLTASMRPSILPPSVVLRTHSPTVAGARSERARPGTVSPLSLPPGRLPRSLPPLGPRTCAALHRRPLTTLALASRSASEPATESVPPLDDEFFLGLSAEAQACTVNGTLAAIAKQLLWAAQPNYLSRSKREAYEQFARGETVAAIAANRAQPIKADTVVGYLAEAAAVHQLPVSWPALFAAADVGAPSCAQVAESLMEIYAATPPQTAASSSQQPLLDLKFSLPDHLTYGHIKVVGAAMACGVLAPGWTPSPPLLIPQPAALAPAPLSLSTPTASLPSTAAAAAATPFSAPHVPSVPAPPPRPPTASAPTAPTAAPPPSSQPSAYEAESRTAWHAARKRGLGGSDIAAVLGVSPWQKPMDVWLSKTGMVAPNAETFAMRRGRLMESMIAEWYAEEMGGGFAVTGGDEMPVRGQHVPAWMLASPDRYVQPQGDAAARFGLEVKTARTSDGWGVPGQGGGATAIPVYYRTQCAWYMAVTGLSRWDVAVYFIANDEFRRYTLERDLGYEARMVAECSHFWHAYVQANVPPPFDDGAGTQAYLKLAHGEVRSAEVAEATPEEAALVRLVAESKQRMLEASALHSQLESQLKACIGDRTGLKGVWGQVTWRKQKGRLRLDQARLKTQHPQLVEQYMVEGFPLRYFRMDLNEHATSEPPPIEN